MADTDYSTEEWRDIPEWEGHYQASSLGRIRSIRREHFRLNPHGWPSLFVSKGRALKERTNYSGYKSVQMSDVTGGRAPRSFRVHRLVCAAFRANPENKPEVAHNDGIRDNNLIDNLRWATRRENLADKKIHSAQRALSAQEVYHRR